MLTVSGKQNLEATFRNLKILVKTVVYFGLTRDAEPKKIPCSKKGLARE
jgi:hypothetical protein